MHIDLDLRHDLVNGMCAIRAVEMKLKEGNLTPEQQIAEAKVLDEQIQRVLITLKRVEEK